MRLNYPYYTSLIWGKVIRCNFCNEEVVFNINGTNLLARILRLVPTWF